MSNMEILVVLAIWAVVLFLALVYLTDDANKKTFSDDNPDYSGSKDEEYDNKDINDNNI